MGDSKSKEGLALPDKLQSLVVTGFSAYGSTLLPGTATGQVAGAVVGQAAGELVAHLVRGLLSATTSHWFPSLGRRLLEEGLEAEVSDPEREDLRAVVLEATLVAYRTTREEKLEALRSAVVNVAARRQSDLDLTAVFLTLVDRFTPSHLRALTLFQSPAVFAKEQGVELPHASKSLPLQNALRLLASDLDPTLVEQVCLDLLDRGLIKTSRNYEGEPTFGTNRVKWTTETGDRFLAFISRPTIPK